MHSTDIHGLHYPSTRRVHRKASWRSWNSSAAPWTDDRDGVLWSWHFSSSSQRVCYSRSRQTLISLLASVTNADGRCLDLLPPAGSDLALKEDTALAAGQTYKVVFKTKEYFEKTGRKSFYPWVEVSSPLFKRWPPSEQGLDHICHWEPSRPLPYSTLNQSLFFHDVQRKLNDLADLPVMVQSTSIKQRLYIQYVVRDLINHNNAGLYGLDILQIYPPQRESWKCMVCME